MGEEVGKQMYVFIDIEATGGVPSEAFQVAMVITNTALEVQEMLNFYVEHDQPISEHVLELCHLEKKDLLEIDKLALSRNGAVQIVERVFEKYDEDIIIVGKMVKGDIKWLRKIGACCNRMEFMEDTQYIEVNQFFEGNHKLSEDCLQYGIEMPEVLRDVKELINQDKISYGTQRLFGGGYHNALVDAYATYKLIKRMTIKQEIELETAVETYDWTNRSYLMMNRKAMEDDIAVKIYRNHLLKEIKEEYGINVAYKKLQAIDSITFENGCMMGVTKKEILLNAYLPELQRSKRPHFNRYEVRLRRGKYIKKVNIIALNRFDLFIQLSKKISPEHIPKSFEKKSVLVGLLQHPSAYLEANGYTLLSIKQRESQIDYRVVS